MKVRKTVDQETRDLIVKLYTAVDGAGKRRHTLAEITAMTGVGRSSIYYTLEREGVHKDRSNRLGDSELAVILRECQAENQQLRDQVYDLSDQLERANKVIDGLTRD